MLSVPSQGLEPAQSDQMGAAFAALLCVTVPVAPPRPGGGPYRALVQAPSKRNPAIQFWQDIYATHSLAVSSVRSPDHEARQHRGSRHGCPAQAWPTASTDSNRPAVPSARSRPRRVADADADAWHRSSEPERARDHRRSVHHRPLVPARLLRSVDRSGGAPEAPPTAAARPAVTRPPARASTSELVPPRRSPLARPRSPAETPTTQHPARDVNGVPSASADRLSLTV